MEVPREVKDGRYELTAEFRRGKTTWSDKIWVSVKTSVPCHRLTPVIDGNLKEWSGLPEARLERREQVKVGLVTEAETYVPTSMLVKDPWRGVDDLSGVIRIAWDQNNLYLAAKVKDNDIVNKARFQAPFKGDCLELFIDQRCLKPRKDGQKGSENIFQVMFVPPDKSFDKCSFLVYQGAEYLGDVEMASQVEATGYTMEIAIPWKNFGIKSPGKDWTLGLDVSLDDADSDYEGGTKRKSLIVWHGDGSNYAKSTKYGLIHAVD
jgi:hypothetical protein